jgi:hypothetical protein
LARAFLAKAVFNLPTVRALLDRLRCDAVARRLCGWEKVADVPHESAFSRAFAEFAQSEFPQRVHAALVQRTQSERLIGHILRDSTAIEAREKTPTQSQTGNTGAACPAGETGKAESTPPAARSVLVGLRFEVYSAPRPNLDSHLLPATQLILQVPLQSAAAR